MINKSIIILFIFFTTTHVWSNNKIGYTCFGDVRDRKSNEFVKDIYGSAKIVGTFEVVEIGPQKEDSMTIGRAARIVKFRPIEILKGKVGTTHLLHSGILGQPDDDFRVGDKYLIAFKNFNGDGSSKDGPCERAFRVKLPEAKFYIEKFKSLHKSTE